MMDIDKEIDKKLNELINLMKKKVKIRCNKCDSKKYGCEYQEYDLWANVFNIIRSKCPTLIFSNLLISYYYSGGKILGLSISEGGSMYPAQSDGDISILGVQREKTRIGDHITFYHPNSDVRIGHRVVSKDENFIYTRGDSCKNGERIIESAIASRVIKTIKKGSKLWKELFPLLNKND